MLGWITCSLRPFSSSPNWSRELNTQVWNHKDQRLRSHTWKRGGRIALEWRIEGRRRGIRDYRVDSNGSKAGVGRFTFWTKGNNNILGSRRWTGQYSWIQEVNRTIFLDPGGEQENILGFRRWTGQYSWIQKVNRTILLDSEVNRTIFLDSEGRQDNIIGFRGEQDNILGSRR